MSGMQLNCETQNFFLNIFKQALRPEKLFTASDTPHSHKSLAEFKIWVILTTKQLKGKRCLDSVSAERCWSEEIESIGEKDRKLALK